MIASRTARSSSTTNKLHLFVIIVSTCAVRASQVECQTALLEAGLILNLLRNSPPRFPNGFGKFLSTVTTNFSIPVETRVQKSRRLRTREQVMAMNLLNELQYQIFSVASFD